MKDLNTLQRKATTHGHHVGAYAAALHEHSPSGRRTGGQTQRDQPGVEVADAAAQTRSTARHPPGTTRWNPSPTTTPYNRSRSYAANSSNKTSSKLTSTACKPISPANRTLPLHPNKRPPRLRRGLQNLDHRPMHQRRHVHRHRNLVRPRRSRHQRILPTSGPGAAHTPGRHLMRLKVPRQPGQRAVLMFAPKHDDPYHQRFRTWLVATKRMDSCPGCRSAENGRATLIRRIRFL